MPSRRAMPKTAKSRWPRPSGASPPDSPDWVFGAFVGDELAGVVGLAREPRAKNRHKACDVRDVRRAGSRQARRRRASSCGTRSRRRGRNPGLEQLVLTVTETNVAARTLYEKLGFRSFGIEPRAIRVGDAYFDKNHMILFLTLP